MAPKRSEEKTKLEQQIIVDEEDSVNNSVKENGELEGARKQKD